MPTSVPTSGPIVTTPEGFDLAYAMTLPPEEAVAYFRQKGLRVSKNWHDILGKAHDQAFTVAGVARLDVLQTIRDAVGEAVKGQVSFADFKKNLTPLLKRKGWWGKAIDAETGEITKTYPGTSRPVQMGSAFRLKLIYDVNLQNAFQAGRRARQIEAVETHPYWEYVAVMDSRTRPEHRVLNGRVLRYDDAFWLHFYPPNGYRCRCRVRTRMAMDVGTGAGQIPSSISGKRLSQVEVPVSKTRPELGTAKVWRYEYDKGKFVQTDVGWGDAPGAAWKPDMSRIDADLQAQYKRERAKQ